MTKLVTYRQDGRVGYIGLNRPEKLNAINQAMLSDFQEAVNEFRDDPQTRVGIVYGEGRSFCVGMDLTGGAAHRDGGSSGGYADATQAHQINNRPKGEVAAGRDRIQHYAEIWLQLWDCPKPIIAQIHGYCIAAGTQIPIFCDLVAVADDAVFGWPKLPVGGGYISPMWAWAVGPHVAKEMSFIAGSTMTAERAHATGYANLLFPSADLAISTRAVADQIALMASELLRIKKLAINRVMELQGFRTAVLMGAEWDAIAHTTDAVGQVREWIRDLGLKEAIATYQAQGV